MSEYNLVSLPQLSKHSFRDRYLDIFLLLLSPPSFFLCVPQLNFSFGLTVTVVSFIFPYKAGF